VTGTIAPLPKNFQKQFESAKNVFSVQVKREVAIILRRPKISDGCCPESRISLKVKKKV